MATSTSFTLNGQPVRVASDPSRMLVWVLRQELGLTGTKLGCGAGLCGACTVLVDLEPAPSCSTALADVAGKSVLTIEGLALEGSLNPVQQAFQDHHAFQCGFCTPGMILTAYALLRKHPGATRAQVIAGLDGNLCRCGAHVRILDAVAAAGKAMGGGL
jgi:aerobic-type carbon monoxide dehydrogenase small subunit (CoxS/CutS family)